MANPAGELIMRCFHARTNAHLQHLSVSHSGSYAAHKALNEFYDDIVDLVDSFAEAYQGEYDLIKEFDLPFTLEMDSLKMLDELVKWIEQTRDEICDETYCQNIIDEIVALIRSTQYKLKFLK